MKQLDVCRLNSTSLTGRDRLVVVLQHADFEPLSGVLVAPLYAGDEVAFIERFRVRATINRRPHIIAVDRLASVPKRQLRGPVGNLDAKRYEIFKAIDLLLSGF